MLSEPRTRLLNFYWQIVDDADNKAADRIAAAKQLEKLLGFDTAPTLETENVRIVIEGLAS